MASTYPGTLDSFATNHVDDVGEVIEAADINDLADATNKIEAELSSNPSGSFSTVAARLNARLTCRKTANQTINSTTNANVTDMVLPVDTTGIDYFFQMHIPWTNGAVGVALWFAIDAPTIGGYLDVLWESTTATDPAIASTDMVATQFRSGDLTFFNHVGTATFPAASGAGYARCTGILSNPTATGSLQLVSRLETGTTAATIKRGAWGEICIG